VIKKINVITVNMIVSLKYIDFNLIFFKDGVGTLLIIMDPAKIINIADKSSLLIGK